MLPKQQKTQVKTAKFDELAVRVNAGAIRYATGGWVTSMPQA